MKTTLLKSVVRTAAAALMLLTTVNRTPIEGPTTTGPSITIATAGDGPVEIVASTLTAGPFWRGEPACPEPVSSRVPSCHLWPFQGESCSLPDPSRAMMTPADMLASDLRHMAGAIPAGWRAGVLVAVMVMVFPLLITALVLDALTHEMPSIRAPLKKAAQRVGRLMHRAPTGRLRKLRPAKTTP